MNPDIHAIGFGHTRTCVTANDVVTDFIDVNVSLCVGNEAKVMKSNSTAIGNHSCSSENSSISIGSFTSAIHEDAIVIGEHASSEKAHSVLINSENVKINNVEVKKGELNLANDVGILYNGESKLEENKVKCGGCNEHIIRGIKWIRDGYVLEDGTVYKNIDIGLCFDCIFDCVLSYRAELSWNTNNKK